jgi:signal transduction histidine kinase
VNYSTNGSITTSLGIAFGNTMEGLVGAWLVGRFAEGPSAFRRSRSIIAFIVLAAMCSTAISATAGLASLVLGGFARFEESGPIWLTWWMGDLSSNLIVAPFFLVWWTERPPRLVFRSVLEAAALIFLLFVAGQIIFGGWFPTTLGHHPLEYLYIPLLLWAVFRFTQHGSVTGSLLISVFAIRGTLHGTGPFAVTDPNTALVLLQSFSSTLAATGLILAGVISEQRRVEEALRRKTIEAEEASRVKSAIVANVSHELRTPLNAIVGFTDLLLRGVVGQVGEEGKAALQRIARNAEDLRLLIDQVLDLSRLQAGGKDLSVRRVDLASLLKEVLDNLQPLLTKKSLTLSVEKSEILPTIESDPGKLKQILVNLLSNAIKFTLKGGIAVGIKDLPQKDGVEIKVRDSGIGIPPEKLSQIFEPFYQVDGATTRSFGGTGLGLTIVKTLVDEINGRIDVESGYGTGTVFSIFIPYRQPLSPADAHPSPGSDRRA